MRQLTKKQKKLIDQWCENNKEHVNLAFSIDTCEAFDPVWYELVKINDTEILWQEVNRYISEK